jgi:nitroreductase
MELLDAIKDRKSVRAFKSDPVPTETIKKILEISCRAPSSVNSQPWEFFVVKGAVLDKLKTVGGENLRQGNKPNPDVPLPDPEKGDMGLPGIYKKRQVVLGVTMLCSFFIRGKHEKNITVFSIYYYSNTICPISYYRSYTGSL